MPYTQEELRKLVAGDGAMASPVMSIEDMYGGIYSETGAAPTKRVVQTTKVTPSYAEKNKNDIIDNKPPAAQPATARASTIDTIEPLDITRLGLTTNPFDTSAARAIAQATRKANVDPIGAGPLSYGSLIGMMFDPSWNGSPGAAPMTWSSTPAGPAPKGDPWATPGGGDLRIGPSGAAKPGYALGNAAAPAPAAQSSSPSISSLFGGHDTSSPEAFAASVTRPSNMPGVEAFNGKVEMGSAGQNRYGSTAGRELAAMFGF